MKNGVLKTAKELKTRGEMYEALENSFNENNIEMAPPLFHGTDASLVGCDKEERDLINISCVTIIKSGNKVLNICSKPRSYSPFRDIVIPYIAKENPNANLFHLWSQFRCGQDEGYLTWVEKTLGMEPETISFSGVDPRFDFDVRLVTNEEDLFELLEKENVRVLATKSDGYKEVKKNGKQLFYSIYANRPDDCIPVYYPTDFQGLEYDTVLVIIGNDLKIDLVTTITKKDEINYLKNQYRLLLTRGLHKCYIYCLNQEMKEHFNKSLENKETIEKKLD